MTDGQSGAPSRTATFSNRYVMFAVGMLSLTNLVNYMDRMVLSVLLPLIKTDLGLSDTQLGLLTGFAFALFYAAFGIPIVRWADRGVRRNIIALALTVWLPTATHQASKRFSSISRPAAHTSTWWRSLPSPVSAPSVSSSGCPPSTCGRSGSPPPRWVFSSELSTVSGELQSTNFGEIHKLPLRDPMTLEPIVE